MAAHSSSRTRVTTWVVVGLSAIVLVLGGAVGALVAVGQRSPAPSTVKAEVAVPPAQGDAVAAPAASSDGPSADGASANQAAQAAADKARAERAAAKKAARVAKKKAAAEQAAADAAAAEAATRHHVSGAMTAPDINGALVTQVGGYPGEPLSSFDMKQLNTLESLLKSLKGGRTYPCPGGAGGGYNDIVAGAQVVIEDGTGSTLATTDLRGGTLGMHGCTFTFEADVLDAPFYRITVTHRGAVTYSRDDMERSGWHADLKL
jgi:hypothetical protein